MPYLRVGEREMLFNKYSILDVLPAQNHGGFFGIGFGDHETRDLAAAGFEGDWEGATHAALPRRARVPLQKDSRPLLSWSGRRRPRQSPEPWAGKTRSLLS